ncbi:MAG: hypothetical protein ACYSR9_13550 [Planctomycetota bacterium]|jgi:hypothetical protein
MGIGENRITIVISDEGVFLERPKPYIQASSDQVEALLLEVADTGVHLMRALLKKGFRDRGLGEYPNLET